MTTTERPTLRVSGPDALIRAVPYLLGFEPTESLVLMGLADGRVVVTARLDLDESDGATVGHIANTFEKGGVTSMVAVTYSAHPVTDPADLPFAQTGRLVTVAMGLASINIADLLYVTGERRWSYMCSEACCPAEGIALPAEPLPFEAAAVAAGLSKVSTREALADTIAPGEPIDQELIDVHIDNPMPAAAIIEAIRADKELDDATLVRIASALLDFNERDAVWSAIDGDKMRERRVLQQLAVRLPETRLAAAPLLLVGWSAWRAGDGAVANIAGERLLEADPGYTAGHLLRTVLEMGVDPRKLPPLAL